MLGKLTKGIEVIRSSIIKTPGDWERLEDNLDDERDVSNLRLVAMFGRIALNDYRRGYPIYKNTMDGFRDEMISSKLKLSDLGFADVDNMVFNELTDLN